jgi:hypothetical protein
MITTLKMQRSVVTLSIEENGRRTIPEAASFGFFLIASFQWWSKMGIENYIDRDI